MPTDTPAAAVVEVDMVRVVAADVLVVWPFEPRRFTLLQIAQANGLAGWGSGIGRRARGERREPRYLSRESSFKP